MQHNQSITVLIPALDEENAIGKVVRTLPDWVDRVIVADNGSRDRTAVIAAEAGAEVVHEPERGYGAACLAAMDLLRDDDDIIVFMDGDLSDDPGDMSALVEPIIENQADLVIGSRKQGVIEHAAMTGPARFGNWLACRLIHLIWGFRYTDLGPFRAISRTALTSLEMTDRNYGWTVEMQIRGLKRNLRIREVPVRYRKQIGRSKVSGTVRGIIGAGYKILLTIARHGCVRKQPATGGDAPGPDAFSSLSVIIPALNEAAYLQETLDSVRLIPNVEIIVADGGSDDETTAIAKAAGAGVFHSAAGRGIQMNRGAQAATGDILLFLHADTRLPEQYASKVFNSLTESGTAGGAFSLEIDCPGWMARMIEWGVVIRSRYFGLPFGDQGLFLTRSLFKRINGFEEIPIMEDFDFVRRLHTYGRIRIVDSPVTTSGRRWEKLGWLTTTLLNQIIISAYLLGAAPDRLARWYGKINRSAPGRPVATQHLTQKGNQL